MPLSLEVEEVSFSFQPEPSIPSAYFAAADGSSEFAVSPNIGPPRLISYEEVSLNTLAVARVADVPPGSRSTHGRERNPAGDRIAMPHPGCIDSEHRWANANLSAGTGTVTASGGTMNLREQVASGVTLAITSGTASTLNISNTATVATNIAVNSSSQTLEVATGGNLTITASENISNGTLNMQGGTVTTFGSIANNATLTGSDGNIVLTVGDT
jgi:hypothetical protein